MWAQAFASGVSLAAALLEIAAELFGDDALKRLESDWLDEITGTYMDWLAAALSTESGAEGVSAVLADLAHAELIAMTEVNRGENAGAYEVYRANRVPLVNWVTTSANPCPQCIDNRDASPWPLGKPFPSGVIMPPDHPHCQCHLEPA